ncbi:MAG: aspartate 1-decarboxylase [Candidatus Thermoplasmatota archaeon]|nr:aspartate 1-decarboxylase [Euryarchaeota archaeon]MED5272332.1 aspartate 1-decarboxylase [Candidatus Thermoplasmatota archaeon]MED5485662.1 aspartate 1-decarboxylase [Candidatus Thermoplasmatota archaeon]|tara:strand:+ start:607 stop:936 length:330 start_codon:yes stop_codon:yes gene_type:complete
MLITKLKSKVAYAKVTQTELFYVGSITIDENIMNRAVLSENEKVQVVNINNGSRIETYVIKGEAGSGIIALNGPAARHAQVGDDLFILSWAQIDPASEDLEPVIVDLKK